MKYIFPLIAFGLVLLCESCIGHKELLNFSEGDSFLTGTEAITNLPKIILQSDDLILIKVKALDEEAAMPFNLDLPTTGTNLNISGGVRPMIGYLVGADGVIDFPVLGSLHVAGMTTGEVARMVTEKLRLYIKDPLVTVRFLNFRVTVIGEVLSPSTFFLSNERVTVLDALGQAGDLTPYANRRNILIVRENGVEREYGYLNLQSRDIFQSKYFYLKQNDVIYVEPLPVKTASIRDQSQRILPWISVITSLTTLVISLTR